MLDDNQILNIIGSELSNSTGGGEGDAVEGNRKAALGMYLGQPDGREVEGRSKVTSTDVADAIEWIMPEVIKAFTQNNEIVTFDPCFSGDEKQAELESKYVYDILMKDNNGFLVLHQFFKDALLQKNGFLKVFYSNDIEISKEAYTGITEIELSALMQDPELEIIEMSEIEGEIPTYDIRVERTVNASKVNVNVIAPENFRINSQHNSVDISNPRFCAHVELKTASEVVQMGFDKDFVDEIPSSDTYNDASDYRFYTQGESTGLDNSNNLDPSSRLIEVAECFMYLDTNEDGIAEYVKVTVAGGENPTHVLEMEEVNSSPFISSTAILMSHKLFGLSIYDRLKQIQDQKTSLWRNILDNMYLQNNQRTVVIENQVNLDDLLVSRPGGIIRAKTANAVQPYATPPLPSDAYKMMDYLDQVRAGRAGVSPEGAITDNMVGDRVGSEGVEKMMSQKEELVGLMVRVFAETGIKPLCYKVRQEVVMHQDVAKEYMFRGQWVKVNPATWRKKRATSTVRVGTGSGNRQAQQNAIMQLMSMQEKILQNPSQALVVEQKVFDAIDDFAKFSGLPGASKYFLDPESPEGQANKKQVSESSQQAQQAELKEKQMLAETQTKIADAEVQKAQAQMANVQMKAQIDQLKAQIESSKNMSEAQMSSLRQQLEEAKAALAAKKTQDELEFKYWQTTEQLNVQREQINANKQEPKNGQDGQA